MQERSWEEKVLEAASPTGGSPGSAPNDRAGMARTRSTDHDAAAEQAKTAWAPNRELSVAPPKPPVYHRKPRRHLWSGQGTEKEQAQLAGTHPLPASHRATV